MLLFWTTETKLEMKRNEKSAWKDKSRKTNKVKRKTKKKKKINGREGEEKPIKNVFISEPNKNECGTFWYAICK